MRKINLNALFPLLLMCVLIYALSQQLFKVSPLGKLLNPFIGAVQNESTKAFDTRFRSVTKTGVVDSVHVFFDDRKVPHIFAKNTHDLYFTQGYVTASLRLWQMDFISYASAGRLSEIFADGFVDYDRNQRRTGMLASARSSLKFIESDSVTNAVLNAYTSGVNAYIRELHYKDLPFEYKLLDYNPEPWSNLKTVLIMKYMAALLSGYEEDYSMSNMMLALKEKDFNILYPDFQGPITPVKDGTLARIDSAGTYIKRPGYLDYAFLSQNAIVPDSMFNPALGSNSWAVSGKKTRSGHPILCNDPHLNLSLPAIWLEMQLCAPQLNTYGVSIPGTPAIIIGFNENIAWGITNGSDDVKDWYKLKIRQDYKQYELDGKWIDLDYTIEEIRRKNQQPLYDTIYQTVYGPVANDKSYSRKSPVVNHALKWEMHRPSNEFLAFIKLNAARNYDDYKNAIKNYSCPIQNFTFACKDNTIAITHQGAMPIKGAGEGKFILDGSTSEGLAENRIPSDSLPQILNPSCNYVLSANQHPTAPGYKYYYNGYFREIRANRIRQLLEANNQLDMAAMQGMQLDNVNAFAVDALPVLMATIAQNKLNEQQQLLLRSLKEWKGNYGIGETRAHLFEIWWKRIREYTWDELNRYSFYSRSPDDYRLLEMIQKEPDNNYFDRLVTSQKEKAGDIITSTFTAAVAQYQQQQLTGNVQWDQVNKVNLMHLTKIKTFSRTDLPSAGYKEAINAMSSNWGPSWRMIVELGDRPKAVGVYAGGQSGNIGSPYYDNFIDSWNKGKYFELLFFISEKEAVDKTNNTWLLQ